MDALDRQIVHPQHGSAPFDHVDKRVVLIGSGATAVTPVPATAARAERATMLRRSPTHIMRSRRGMWPPSGRAWPWSALAPRPARSGDALGIPGLYHRGRGKLPATWDAISKRAAGLKRKLPGGATIEVDGNAANASEIVFDKGMRSNGIANVASNFGDTGASWPLKCARVAR